MRRDKNPDSLEACFRVLVEHAVAGKRCPENGTFGVTSDLTTALCRAGRVRVEISGHNYRTVVILEGEHAGKTTAPNPPRGPPWKIIDKATTVNGRVRVPKTSDRQPSAPRILSSAEIFGGRK